MQEYRVLDWAVWAIKFQIFFVPTSASGLPLHEGFIEGTNEGISAEVGHFIK